MLRDILVGLIVILLHLLLELLHLVGYPIAGVRLWFLFIADIYPTDEPELPLSTHVRRALGGPIMSLLVTLLAEGSVLLLHNVGSPYTWIAGSVFRYNLSVFTLGALCRLASLMAARSCNSGADDPRMRRIPDSRLRNYTNK